MEKIQTKYFGEVEVEAAGFIHFEEGLPGFEGYHSYALLHFDEENESLVCLQSTDKPDLAFVVMNPCTLLAGYEPKLAPADEKALAIGAETPVNLLAIVVVKEDWQSSTANLKCPIVINAETLQARQVLLEADYPLRQPIVSEKRGA